MKRFYLIGGPMGVGKTAVCRELKARLPNSVFLDGDWCWDAHPFQVTKETKAMVMDNICHVLNNFLHCSAYENVIFCWVMDRPEILEELRKRLDTDGWEVTPIVLVCEEEALRQRLRKDIRAGLRKEDILGRSAEYLARCVALDIPKIDTTGMSVEQTAERLTGI